MSKRSNTSSQTELSQLRTRIAELEHALTDAHKRERALQASETRLLYTLEGSNDGAWDWDIVADQTFFSPRWSGMLGYEPDELPGHPSTWQSRLHPEESPQIALQVQDCLEGHIPAFECEHRMLHKSGSWVWMLSRGRVVVRNTAGEAVRMTGTMSDITARKQAEDQLRQSQRLLQAVMDHSPAVVYVRDADYRYLMVNHDHAALVNKSVEQIIGKADYELFPPDTITCFRQTDRLVVEHGQTTTTEETIQQPDGLHTYISVKFPLLDDDGTLYAICGISTDVTEARRAAEERATLQEQMILAQRATLRELSTPLIPIADGIVILPLIGTIDEQRAQQILEALLEGVAQHRATAVILDITGVQIVDTHVASALVQAAQAVRLLGADVIVTGIRPEIAQIIIDMGQDLRGMVTHGTLQMGIAYALQRRHIGMMN